MKIWREFSFEAAHTLPPNGLHGLRMLGQVSDWPLASADSTNCAQNFARDTGCARCKADHIHRQNWNRKAARTTTGDLFWDVMEAAE